MLTSGGITRKRILPANSDVGGIERFYFRLDALLIRRLRSSQPCSCAVIPSAIVSSKCHLHMKYNINNIFHLFYFLSLQTKNFNQMYKQSIISSSSSSHCILMSWRGDEGWWILLDMFVEGYLQHACVLSSSNSLWLGSQNLLLHSLCSSPYHRPFSSQMTRRRLSSPSRQIAPDGWQSFQSAELKLFIQSPLNSFASNSWRSKCKQAP